MNRSLFKVFVRLRVLIALLALVIIGYFRFFILKQSSYGDILLAVSEALIVSVIVFLLVEVSTLLVRTPSFEDQSLELVQVGDITARSRANAQGSTRWEYIGHVGRHTRTVVFNAYSERASSHGNENSMDVLLISPFSDKAVELYCNHKRSAQVRHYDSEPVSKDDVRAEIFATILRCKSLVQDHPQFTIRLFLSDFFSAFRYDVSPDEIIMTQEDAFLPALAIKKESQLFLAVQRECASIRSQSRQVWFHADTVDIADELSSKEFIDRTFADYPFVEGHLISLAVSKLRNDKNPYAG